MSKLKMHSPDLTAVNIDRLAALFPNCVTESADEKGQLHRAVDFDLLRQELSGAVVEGPVERYTLNWPGKREAIVAANAPINKTLRPCEAESVDFDTTRNLYIEGDNLEVLKLLQETYLGKVKMIYIDPPYNTGNDFIYRDHFTMDKEDYELEIEYRDTEGNIQFRQNNETNPRFHSDWLSMIYPRVKLARDLLHEDGVFFVSIDDHEVHNFRKICDEVFGADCFRANVVWRRTVSSAVSGQGFGVSHEHLLCYTKKDSSPLNRLPVDDEDKYTNADNDPRGVYKTQKLERTLEGARPTMTFAIESPKGKITKTWAVSPEKFQQLLLDNRIVFSSSGVPYYKQFLSEYKGRLPDTWWGEGTGNNQEASKELKALFGEKNYFTNPKPTKLIDQALRIGAAAQDSIILDFFSGSATTAHAVMQLNAADGGNRRFIMVQLPEVCDETSEVFKAGYKTICEIGKERIRRAGRKIKEENATNAPNLDVGFRVFKLDSSNMKDVYYTPDATEQSKLDLFADAIKEDRTAEDLLFQVFLDCGLDLALPVAKEKVGGKTVFVVDQNVLVACFASDIPESLIRELAKRKPLKAVFLDRSFAKDSTKLNVTQIFKQLSPATEVKTL